MTPTHSNNNGDNKMADPRQNCTTNKPPESSSHRVVPIVLPSLPSAPPLSHEIYQQEAMGGRGNNNSNNSASAVRRIPASDASWIARFTGLVDAANWCGRWDDRKCRETEEMLRESEPRLFPIGFSGGFWLKLVPRRGVAPGNRKDAYFPSRCPWMMGVEWEEGGRSYKHTLLRLGEVYSTQGSADDTEQMLLQKPWHLTDYTVTVEVSQDGKAGCVFLLSRDGGRHQRAAEAAAAAAAKRRGPRDDSAQQASMIYVINTIQKLCNVATVHHKAVTREKLRLSGVWQRELWGPFEDPDSVRS